ncbi:hypothetical protein N8290_04455, partial [Pseudomonadales bacterium]|nr:hypothetical protein [Pseudomonadales bacterium]
FPPHCTLPHNQYPPANIYQLLIMAFITLYIAHNFITPEFGIISRPLKKPAAVSVPEAAMHEDNGVVACKNKIRFS